MPGALDESSSHSKPEKHSGPELERTGRWELSWFGAFFCFAPKIGVGTSPSSSFWGHLVQ